MLVPKLRFKREDGTDYPEWEKQRIGDLFYKVNERNNGQFDKTKWISVAKMYYQVPDKVTSNNIDTRTYVMRIGDMAFEGHPNSDFLFGRFVVNDIGDGVISELFPIYRHKTEYVLKYWKYAIQIEKVMAHIYRRSITSSGASSNKLNNDDFQRESICVPCLEEQKKIADFLSTVDEVIAQSEAEVQNLEQQKKAAMQKIFSQEVRFKREDGTDYPEWEKQRIGDLFYKVNERNNGQFDKTKWISVAKMYYQVPDKVTSNNIDTRTYVMRIGDMAFEGHPNSDFLFGRFVVNDIGDGVISELFPIYRHKTEYVLKYWKYAIQIEKVMAHIYRRSITSSGASSNKLNNDDFQRESICVPCLEEQKKIADFLSAYDEAISYAKQELDKWKELKKGLLQQMFV